MQGNQCTVARLTFEYLNLDITVKMTDIFKHLVDGSDKFLFTSYQRYSRENVQICQSIVSVDIISSIVAAVSKKKD